jgi:HupF/HypC family
LTSIYSPAPDTVCGSTHCVTCGDDGDPMTAVSVDESQGLAVCHRGDGAQMTVEIGLVAPVSPGELLLVHAGTAIARIE